MRSCRVWSVFDRKAKRLAGLPGILQNESNPKKQDTFFIEVPGTAGTYQDYKMLGLHIL